MRLPRWLSKWQGFTWTEMDSSSPRCHMSSSSSSWVKVESTPGATAKAKAKPNPSAGPLSGLVPEGPAGGEGEAEAEAAKPKGKKNQSCMSCHVQLMANELLLLTENPDWCSHLWGHCFSCSVFNKEEWENDR